MYRIHNTQRYIILQIVYMYCSVVCIHVALYLWWHICTKNFQIFLWIMSCFFHTFSSSSDVTIDDSIGGHLQVYSFTPRLPITPSASLPVVDESWEKWLWGQSSDLTSLSHVDYTWVYFWRIDRLVGTSSCSHYTVSSFSFSVGNFLSVQETDLCSKRKTLGPVL